jgi:hypothetical protein
MESLKTLLKTQGISLNTEKAISGQIDQKQNKETYDLLEPENSLNQLNKCGRRLVWFRTLAFQANDPGFKSRRPHQIFTNFFKLERFCVRSLFSLEAYQVQVTKTFLHPNQRLLTRNRLQRINPKAPRKPLVQRLIYSLI